MQVADVVVVVKCNRTMSVCPSVDSENSITYAEILLKCTNRGSARTAAETKGISNSIRFKCVPVRVCVCEWGCAQGRGLRCRCRSCILVARFE